MKHWTIRRRIIGGFVVVMATMLVMGAVAYFELVRIDGQARAMASESLPELADSGQLLATWNTNYSGHPGNNRCPNRRRTQFSRDRASG